MPNPPRPEAWLRGPIDGVPIALQPVAHALVQASEEISSTLAELEDAHLRAEPAGIASISFHVRHLAGSTDRLFTYAAGRALSEAQRSDLADERGPGPSHVTAPELVELWSRTVEDCLERLRGWDPEALTEAREVGAKRLPSTAAGLLFHAAEHAARHVGQVVTTAKIVTAG